MARALGELRAHLKAPRIRFSQVPPPSPVPVAAFLATTRNSETREIADRVAGGRTEVKLAGSPLTVKILAQLSERSVRLIGGAASNNLPLRTLRCSRQGLLSWCQGQRTAPQNQSARGAVCVVVGEESLSKKHGRSGPADGRRPRSPWSQLRRGSRRHPQESGNAR